MAAYKISIDLSAQKLKNGLRQLERLGCHSGRLGTTIDLSDSPDSLDGKNDTTSRVQRRAKRHVSMEGNEFETSGTGSRQRSKDGWLLDYLTGNGQFEQPAQDAEDQLADAGGDPAEHRAEVKQRGATQNKQQCLCPPGKFRRWSIKPSSGWPSA